MPFVPGFQYDVFLSYARGISSDWMKEFQKKLTERLNERVPGVEFFQDTRNLSGNDELTPALVSAIRGSAVLVPVVSRMYLTRPWCIRECEEFVAAGGKPGGRIFPVWYDDVNKSDFQKIVGEKLGYEFCTRSAEEKHPDTLAPDCKAFNTKMNDLRMEIGFKLEALKDEAKKHAANHNRIADETLPKVFLAATAPGLNEQADQLAAFLRDYVKCDVVRPGERFYELSGFENSFVSGFKDCLIFLQLLGRKFQPRDDEKVASWDHWQYLQAQAAGVPTMRWFNKYNRDGTEIDVQRLDADHRAFVTESGIWDCDWQRFSELVRAEIQTRHHHQRQQDRIVAADGQQPLVVLRCERSDQAAIKEIGAELKHLGCDWMRIPDKDLKSLEEFAKEYAANGLLVIYRSCPGTWVLSRLQELRKFLRTEFGRRWACGLWREPEDEMDALSCAVDGLIVIEPQGSRRLHDFVDALRARIPAAVTG